MRRVTALCAAVACLAASTLLPTAASARHMYQAKSGYYVIRWDNTGVCQIWNTDIAQKPITWPSQYKVVSKYVPTFTQAASIQENMRMTRRCTL